ncbi:MAG: hypothetical protein ACLRMZ_02940 [Blautia marasmi]
MTRDSAYLWTDGRYFIQAGKELEDTGITLMKMREEGVPTVDQFLEKTFRRAAVWDATEGPSVWARERLMRT